MNSLKVANEAIANAMFLVKMNRYRGFVRMMQLGLA